MGDQLLSCSANSRMPDLVTHIGKGFVGKLVGSHPGIRLCEDCAERCFFQDLFPGSKCEGFEFKAMTGVTGTCSYYTDIKGVVIKKDINAYTVGRELFKCPHNALM